MPAFRIVHGGRAGPAALGILVPPGNRTVIVVRPRALNVDLVMIRPDTEGFYEASPQAAGLEAQRLGQALQTDATRLAVVSAGAREAVEAEEDGRCPPRPLSEGLRPRPVVEAPRGPLPAGFGGAALMPLSAASLSIP